MIDMVTQIGIYSLRVSSAQDGNPRNKNEFPSFNHLAAVLLLRQESLTAAVC